MDERILLTEEQLSEISGGSDVQKYIHYKIVRGDTLSHLARVYHTTKDELIRINHIKDPNILHPGDYILIPVR